MMVMVPNKGYTDWAGKALKKACSLAAKKGARRAGVGHLLAALVHDSSGVAGYVLRQAGLTYANIESKLFVDEKALAMDGSAKQPILDIWLASSWSPLVFEVLMCMAGRISTELGDHYVGTEHLLLGLLTPLSLKEGAQEVFEYYDLDPHVLRAEALTLLGKSEAKPQSSTPPAEMVATAQHLAAMIRALPAAAQGRELRLLASQNQELHALVLMEISRCFTIASTPKAKMPSPGAVKQLHSESGGKKVLLVLEVSEEALQDDAMARALLEHAVLAVETLPMNSKGAVDRYRVLRNQLDASDNLQRCELLEMIAQCFEPRPTSGQSPYAVERLAPTLMPRDLQQQALETMFGNAGIPAELVRGTPELIRERQELQTATAKVEAQQSTCTCSMAQVCNGGCICGAFDQERNG